MKINGLTFTRRVVSLLIATTAATAAAVVPALVAADPRGDEAAEAADRPTASGGAIVDGRHFGRIDAAYVAPDEIVFDPMTFEVGARARDAAIADGQDPSEVGDFYIGDGDTASTPVPVDAAVGVTRVDCRRGGCIEGTPGDFSQLTLTIAQPDPAAGERYWWITVSDGRVVQIDEQYIA